MREPTVWQPPDVQAIEAAVDRFFDRMTPLSTACVFIAPVCGGCGREIDKTPQGWVHVGLATGDSPLEVPND